VEPRGHGAVSLKNVRVSFDTRFGGLGFDATAFARLARARSSSDASATAAFIGLAGSNFTVLGAAGPRLRPDLGRFRRARHAAAFDRCSLRRRVPAELGQYARAARIRFEF
jgi:hypothetical protein